MRQRILKQLLAGAFGHRHDAVGPLLEALFQCGKKSFGTVQFKGDLGDQSEIHVLVRYRGASCDEPGVPAHEFHKAQAVVNTAGFCVCAVENFDGFLNRSEVTEVRATNATSLSTVFGMPTTESAWPRCLAC